MPENKAELTRSYQKAHAELSDAFYAGETGLTKAQFDFQHGKIWSGYEAALIAAGHRPAPTLPRDLAAEIDSLEGRIRKLEPLR